MPNEYPYDTSYYGTVQSTQVTTLKGISSVHTVSVCFLHIRLWLLHSDAIGILLD